jgi:hypothetical protein
MATMIPALPAHDSSGAELWLFTKLSRLPIQYVVLHSLGLVHHEKKKWAEIDFTIVGPEGVFFIEVKGGTVSRTNGEWQVIRGDRKEPESLGRGPFFQVAGAEAATRRFLSNRLEWTRQITMGYWVFTPDCQLTVDDLGANDSCYYDSRDADIDPVTLVRNMRHMWLKRQRSDGMLNDEQISEIVHQLCADIPMIPSVRRKVNEVERLLHTATLEQERILAAVHRNPRLVIRGAAGTGKSTVALFEIERQNQLGKSVLFCCQSKLLANNIRLQLGSAQSIDVFEVNELLDQIDKKSKTWDVLIVDEAQDLFTKDNLVLFNSVVSGGLAGGVWRIFFDHFQSSLDPSWDDILNVFLANGALNLELTDMVRTTSQIAVTASAFGYVDRLRGGIDGPEVEVRFVKSEEVLDAVVHEVEKLLSEGLSLEEVTVLSPFPLEQGSIDSITKRFTSIVSVSDSSKIRFATTEEMKGMESLAVVLFGLEDLESAFSRRQAYVGCTRAVAILRVFLDQGLEKQVAEAYSELAFRNPAN